MKMLSCKHAVPFDKAAGRPDLYGDNDTIIMNSAAIALAFSCTMDTLSGLAPRLLHLFHGIFSDCRTSMYGTGLSPDHRRGVSIAKEKAILNFDIINKGTDEAEKES